MKRNQLSKLGVLSGALLLSTVTLAGSESADFQRLDQNRDGKLVASEVRGQEELRTQWREIDRDSNGAIGRKEFSAFKAEQQVTIAMGSRSKDFQTLDKDKDGKLSPSEVSEESELSQHWSEIDEDNSGTLDREEFSAFEEKSSRIIEEDYQDREDYLERNSQPSPQ